SDDTLEGGEGDDRLVGGIGADAMSGGLGNDIYYVDDAGDTVTENADEGTDTVVSTVNYTLGDNVENLTLTGTGPLNGTGNALDNRIVGRDGVNVLSGLAGNDVLVGGASDDTLEGGEGDDRLVGGLGNDTAVFAGEISTYSIITSGGSFLVRDNAAAVDGDDGSDRVLSVEYLTFKNAETVSLSAPIILDLDGNGIETINAASSSARFDLNGDGIADDTSWIGTGDAFLFLDRDGNGTMSGADEISFIDDVEEAASDLAGLRAFDSNGDGVLTKDDDRFDDFGIWRDANGDGVVNDGETLSLTEAGIASFDLTGTAVESVFEFGEVAVVNTGSFTLANGEQRTFADAALTYYSGSSAPMEFGSDRSVPTDYASQDPVEFRYGNWVEGLLSSGWRRMAGTMLSDPDLRRNTRYSSPHMASSDLTAGQAAEPQRLHVLPEIQRPLSDLRSTTETEISTANAVADNVPSSCPTLHLTRDRMEIYGGGPLVLDGLTIQDIMEQRFFGGPDALDTDTPAVQPTAALPKTLRPTTEGDDLTFMGKDDPIGTPANGLSDINNTRRLALLRQDMASFGIQGALDERQARQSSTQLLDHLYS
ncbi:calcium-binding protein, partial [Pontixanthobacter sp.]|uniref:calcium-binding protein n=1 Tax=Pontixanthobacter sp. TaxID=2792078 RepID=UPI003C7EA961